MERWVRGVGFAIWAANVGGAAFGVLASLTGLTLPSFWVLIVWGLMGSLLVFGLWQLSREERLKARA